MNNDSRTPLELLAPAGNHDIGKAAIDHGADAVYIGAPRFSARANAGNSIGDIARLIEYAHLFKVRVYLALNTILTDKELVEAKKLIDDLYNAGADGLIIQDFGLLELDLPPIPLIASTQMHNHTPEKVTFLENSGFSRVILARELSLDDIRAIRKQTRVELECFVHGALCVSYSGRCYMSQAAFGRSGNRGTCAQPCRLSYTLKDGNGKDIIKNKHLLSLKDLNLIERLEDLARAGITSFKIEGRYKDAAYVKNVTAAYRKALDRLIDAQSIYRKQSSGTVHFDFTPDLSRTFNRGYTPYFLNAPEGTTHQAAINTPKSTGAAVGTVKALDKKGFTLEGGPVHNGDGMCFLSKDGVLRGFRVERVEKGRIIPSDMRGLCAGLVLFRNHDHAFLKQLEKSKTERRIAVTMEFDQTDREITLTVKDEDGHQASVYEPASYEPAKKPESVKNQILAQLTSTGQTMYSVSAVNILRPEPGFLPVRLLNGLRRKALDRLTLKRREGYCRNAQAEKSPPLPRYPEKTLDYRANIMNRSARVFYERHGAEVRETALESGNQPTGKVLMTTRYCIRRELGACLKEKDTLNLKPPLNLTDGKRSYALDFDCTRCLMHVLGRD